jgi:hypothetical protein
MCSEESWVQKPKSLALAARGEAGEKKLVETFVSISGTHACNRTYREQTPSAKQRIDFLGMEDRGNAFSYLQLDLRGVEKCWIAAVRGVGLTQNAPRLAEGHCPPNGGSASGQAGASTTSLALYTADKHH